VWAWAAASADFRAAGKSKLVLHPKIPGDAFAFADVAMEANVKTAQLKRFMA
jgi:hypothetical protein